jgi:formylglycine-generating enzyme required for sulfatase activity
MNRVIVHSRVGPDGISNLSVPIGAGDAHQQVEVTIEPIHRVPVTEEQWRDFIESTAGSIVDPSFVRHEQGEYQRREELP